METNPQQYAADDASQWMGSGHVVVFSRDVFFGMRIRTSLRQLGYDVTITTDAQAFSGALGASDTPPALGLVDFNQPLDWSSLDEATATGVPLLAFGPHTDVEGFRAARKAGAVRVIANGEFSRSLPALAKRYARSTGIPSE